MRTEHLEFLVSLASTHSISAASRELHISPQGISSAIQGLERELGVQLLVRSRRGISLTEEGHEIVKASKKFLDELDSIRLESADNPMLAGSLEGLLSFEYLTMFEIFILPGLTASFLKKHPRVKLSSHESVSDVILKDVHDGKIDFGLISLLCSENGPIVTSCIDLTQQQYKDNLGFIHLFNDDLYVITNRSHPLARERNVFISDILKYPILSTAVTPKNMIVHYILENQEIYGKPQNLIEINSERVIINLIEENMGVTLVPKTWACYYAGLESLGNIALIHIKDPLYFDCGVIFNRGSVPLIQQLFVNEMKESSRQYIRESTRL